MQKNQTIFCLVRRGGLEPPRCYPLAPQASASANSAISARENYFLVFVAGGGGVRTGAFCVIGARRCSSTLPAAGELRSDIIVSASEVSIKITAAAVVAFESTVAVPRGPKTV